MSYHVRLYANDNDFDTFGFPDVCRGEKLRFENGVVRFDKCVGVDYDTQVSRDGTPVGAFSSEDDYYFYKTFVLLDKVGASQAVTFL